MIIIKRFNKPEEQYTILSDEQENIIMKICDEFSALEEKRMNEVD